MTSIKKLIKPPVSKFISEFSLLEDCEKSNIIYKVVTKSCEHQNYELFVVAFSILMSEFYNEDKYDILVTIVVKHVSKYNDFNYLKLILEEGKDSFFIMVQYLLYEKNFDLFVNFVKLMNRNNHDMQIIAELTANFCIIDNHYDKYKQFTEGNMQTPRNHFSENGIPKLNLKSDELEY